jgi:hypothetical protein
MRGEPLTHLPPVSSIPPQRVALEVVLRVHRHSCRATQCISRVLTLRILQYIPLASPPVLSCCAAAEPTVPVTVACRVKKVW